MNLLITLGNSSLYISIELEILSNKKSKLESTIVNTMFLK